MEDIVGATVLGEGAAEQPLAEATSGIKFVGLYFGAHWAPCCRRFTTTLMEKYNEINTGAKEFEVIFVSKDGNQAHFDRNFAEMPWKSIKYDDEPRKKSLEQKYGVMEIPMLIILGADGKQVSDNGIRDLQNNQSTGIIEAWEKMASQAESEAAAGDGAAAQ